MSPGSFQILLSKTTEHDDIGIVVASAGDGDLLAIPRPGISGNDRRLRIEEGQLNGWAASQRLHVHVRRVPRRIVHISYSVPVRRPPELKKIVCRRHDDF